MILSIAFMYRRSNRICQVNSSVEDGRKESEQDRVAVFSGYMRAFVKAERRESESTTIAIRRLHSHG